MRKIDRTQLNNRQNKQLHETSRKIKGQNKKDLKNIHKK